MVGSVFFEIQTDCLHLAGWRTQYTVTGIRLRRGQSGEIRIYRKILYRLLNLRKLEIKIVTPDGKLRIANAYQNPDLFWALRGGGGGTYGVVLESTSLVEPQMKLQV